MAGNLFLMHEFNGEQVSRHFGVAPHNTHDRAAMHYMFRVMKEEIPAKDRDGLKEVANITIEKIEFRYDVYRGFCEDFFLGSPFDEEALSLAVICDEYVNHVNEVDYAKLEEMDEGTDEIPHRNDGFSDETAKMACTFWEDACSFESGITRGQENQYPPESLFLAHVNALESLREHEQRRDDYEIDEIREIVNVDLPNMRAFARPDTDIGQHLLKFIDYTEQELSVYLAPPKPMLLLPAPPVRPRPVLTLVPRMDNP